MPLYKKFISKNIKYAIWNVTETQEYFLSYLPNNFNNNKNKLEYLSSRYLLEYLKPNFPFNKIIIKNKKPLLLNDNMFFNISHSKNFSSAIISTKNIGLDIQIFSNKIFNIIPKFLNHEEINFFDLNCLQTLIILWSLKEAAYKLLNKNINSFANNFNIEKTIINLNKNIFNKIYVLYKDSNSIIKISIKYYINNDFVFCYSYLE